jgi:hypothetical protein
MPLKCKRLALAYRGYRINEAARARWLDVDDGRGRIYLALGKNLPELAQHYAGRIFRKGQGGKGLARLEKFSASGPRS